MAQRATLLWTFVLAWVNFLSLRVPDISEILQLEANVCIVGCLSHLLVFSFDTLAHIYLSYNCFSSYSIKLLIAPVCTKSCTLCVARYLILNNGISLRGAIWNNEAYIMYRVNLRFAVCPFSLFSAPFRLASTSDKHWKYCLTTKRTFNLHTFRINDIYICATVLVVAPVGLWTTRLGVHGDCGVQGCR